MPTRFSFSANTLVTPSYLTLSRLSRGAGEGVDDPSQSSGVASNQSIESLGDVDVFAVTLLAGETYTFDVDSEGEVDIELDVIDQKGALVLSDDGSASLDEGSSSLADPNLTVEVNLSGIYFVAVHDQEDEYQDGTFAFDTTGGTDTGDYSLVVSTPDIPVFTERLTSDDDKVAFGDGRNKVQAGAGNDKLRLAGGDDLATGQEGNDKLFGGDGNDELDGSNGTDKLKGDDGDDVLIGGRGNDKLKGGDDDDALSGGDDGDIVKGGDGDDILWGEDGGDLINGGDGDDFIRGGDGIDVMRGGDGADTFHFLPGEADFDGDFNEDEILDFELADVIDLSDLRLGTLTFIGTGAYTGADQVRIVDYRDSEGDGFQEVRVNLDADDSSELAFLVDTTTDFTLIAADFIL